MLRRLPAKTFLEWQAFDEINPIGLERFDYLFAGMISWMVNTRRNVEKHPQPFPLSTFLLEWGKRKPKDGDAPVGEIVQTGKSWQELKKMGQGLAALYNMMNDLEEAKKDKRRGRTRANG